MQHDNPPAQSQRPDVRTRFDVQALTPNLSELDRGDRRRWWYWLGVLPSSPRAHIDVHGVHFPKRTERLVPNPLGDGPMQRVPLMGTLARLSENDITRLVAKLKRLVLRHKPTKHEEPGRGINVGDPYERGSSGEIIEIPTDYERKLASRRNKPLRIYQYDHEADQPVACHLYAVLCDNQVSGNRWSETPPSIAEAGLEWPDEIVQRAVEDLI